MSLLTLREISRTYRDGPPVYALRPATLTIDVGEYISVTGRSGSGKSTLLNMLGLLDEPTTGSYQVGGIETAGGRQSLRGAIRGQLFGFVFQAFHLLAGRTALENVELGMLYGPHRHRQRQRLAAEALTRIGLSDRMHADPRQLSGGERQRVAIARAAAARPQVLFCDEPTGNLDSDNTANVLALLRELNTQGMTIVVVTHDEEVAAQAQRRLHLVDGTVTET
jgi:putative ABC transport system ATP-binding protein